MPDLLKHLVVLGLAIPVGVGGYHLAAAVVGEGRDGGAGTAVAADLGLGKADYHLASLPILERDSYWLESRYVERDRLDPEAMFEGALDRVERKVPQVMFQRKPGGHRLNVSVGDFTTVLQVGDLDSLAAMGAQLRAVAAILDEHLTDDIDRRDIEYTFINGALSTLDPHTVLMPPAVAEEMDVDNKGEFGGLGIEITLQDGRLTVKQPIADTPASRAGLKAEDQIFRIDGESTINMDLNDAVGKLRGRKGDPVTIMVMRKGFSQPRPYTIIRDTIKLDPVEGKLLEGNVGYVRIKSFHQGVSTDLADQLARFQRESGSPLRGLVLDLRGNPGGFLNEAVNVSDTFLTDGVIVSTVDGGTGRREEQRANRPGTAPDYPIAVLVNGNSASASEIVAGALRNQDRAVIMGERTFGKGSVQNLYNHDDGSRLKLTVAKYLTPGDQSIQSVGIPPDIELKPAIVEPAVEGDDDQNPLISLYWRQWVDREADLDHVLSRRDPDDHKPTWSLRYLRQRNDAGSVDPQQDLEVVLARRVLLTATGSRRPDVLAAAGRVIKDRSALEQDRIIAAFRDLGLDWSPGPLPSAPQIDVEWDLGDDHKLVAGVPEDISLIVTNTGEEPIYQLSAVSLSDNPYLDHREFYYGALDPGQSRTAQVRVSLPDGYPTEISPVSLDLRTPDTDKLETVDGQVSTQGHDLPRLEYDIRLVDDGSGDSQGNGDGIPQLGETVDLEITLTNIGKGPTREAFARLHNRSGGAVDLRVGNIEVGDPVDAAGQPCEPDSAGCGRVLEPGASYTGRVSFELREGAQDGIWKVDLQVGDNRAYDYASVQRGGFYEFFQLKETLQLKPGQAFQGGLRQPPQIQVTRAPAGKTSQASVTVSGVVTDDHGLRDLMIFHGDDKVFYRGGGHGEKTLPFSVEQPLDPGANLLVILARDDQGLTATHSVTVWAEPPQAEVRVTGEQPAG
ncbi:MAG: PDZ domain-containing protein [Oligoflexia bacterium]|nr:PDZ domain-containing protein [Oligoflexia bacterium]